MSVSVVKQERHDEAEIQELAAKMVEANNAKMSTIQQQQQNSINRPANSANLLSYITRTNENGKTTNNVALELSSKSSSLDDRSQKGQFGWTMLGKDNIPYIFRGDDKYCAVRMVETKVLNKYLSLLHQDIYNCTCIRSYYITETESRLLNEINFIHCDAQFGRDQFTPRDLIVRLSDAFEFYKFLDACYNKLLGNNYPLERCGFVRINKESVVPYTLYNEQKYVPLFYFEGETENLKCKALNLDGWDLSYLKFCYKVQGIRNELFAQDSCSVISLNDIKNYFPPGTLFEDYWPFKTVNTHFLINKTKNQTKMGQWTRQPSTPPIASPKPTNQIRAMAAPYPTLQLRPTRPTVRTPDVSSASTSRQTRNSYYINVSQAPPPPLVRGTQPSAMTYTNAQSTPVSSYMMLGDTTMTHTGYHQTNPQLSKYPPPLIPVRSHYPNAAEVDPNMTAGNNQMMNQRLAHQQVQQQQQQQQQQQVPRTPPGTPANDRVTLNSLTRKLIPIADPPTSGTHIPYKIQKALVEGMMIPCINMKPYVYAELLVTLNDLITYFFNNVPINSCHQVMQVLGIGLYKGNNSQMRVLLENGKCQNINEVVPMVQVRDVIDFMPQLKYMLGGQISLEVVGS